MRAGVTLSVSSADLDRLRNLVSDRNAPQKHVWRGRIVLLSAEGVGTNATMRETGKSKTCVWRWQERFAAEGVEGLLRDKTRPSRVPKLAPSVSQIDRNRRLAHRQSSDCTAVENRTNFPSRTLEALRLPVDHVHVLQGADIYVPRNWIAASAVDAEHRSAAIAKIGRRHDGALLAQRGLGVVDEILVAFVVRRVVRFLGVIGGLRNALTLLGAKFVHVENEAGAVAHCDALVDLWAAGGTLAERDDQMILKDAVDRIDDLDMRSAAMDDDR